MQSVKVTICRLKKLVLLIELIPGAFGIVYKGLLMDWNNVAIRGVALKTLKGIII